MRSPIMTGLDMPPPGSFIFQTRFDSWLQVSGTPLSALMPMPPGPRNCGQSADARPANDIAIGAAKSNQQKRAWDIWLTNFRCFTRNAPLGRAAAPGPQEARDAADRTTNDRQEVPGLIALGRPLSRATGLHLHGRHFRGLENHVDDRLLFRRQPVPVPGVGHIRKDRYIPTAQTTAQIAPMPMRVPTLVAGHRPSRLPTSQNPKMKPNNGNSPATIKIRLSNDGQFWAAKREIKLPTRMPTTLAQIPASQATVFSFHAHIKCPSQMGTGLRVFEVPIPMLGRAFK